MTNTEQTTAEKTYLMLKLDKSKTFWRRISILLLIIVFFVSCSKIASYEVKKEKPKDYIANIQVNGIILDDDYRLKSLKALKDDKHAKAVILTINSPGGAMVPGLELLDELKEISKVKPLVVQMKTIAASAGYLISLSGEYVVANKATLTASVGVLMPLIDATELANKVGVKSAEITSGELKDVTSPFVSRSPKAHEFLQNTVDQLQEIFMAEVKSRRGILPETEEIIKDGRVLIGQKAFELGLIDAIGNQNDLLEYLQKTKNINKDLKVIDYSLEEPESTNFQDLFIKQLTSSVVKNLDTMLYSGSFEPKMIAK
jgi:protease IV